MADHQTDPLQKSIFLMISLLQNCKGWSADHDTFPMTWLREMAYTLDVWGNLKTKLFDKPNLDLVDS